MNAYKNRLGLIFAMATCIVALAVPAAGRAASIARCDVKASTPFHLRSEGRKIFYGARVRCNGSVTLDKVVVKLQKQRFGGGWRVIHKLLYRRVEVRHRGEFRYFKPCIRRLVGTFRTKAVITKGSNSETDASAEEHIRCTAPGRPASESPPNTSAARAVNAQRHGAALDHHPRSVQS